MRGVPTTVRARAAAVAVGLVLVFALSTARLFVWPPTDRPARADAVVALGGDPGERRAHEAIALVEAGFAPVALISLGGKRPVPCPAITGRGRVMCFRADPLNTRGEAEHASAVAKRLGWTRLIVVSERSQATRARMLFRRCTAARLDMVPVADRASHLPYDVVYEWGALLKALTLHRSC